VIGRQCLVLAVLIGVVVTPLGVHAAQESESSEAPSLSGDTLDPKQFSIDRGLLQLGAGTKKSLSTGNTFLPGQFSIDAGLRRRQSSQPVILAQPLTDIKSETERSTSKPKSNRELIDKRMDRARALESSGKPAASIQELKKLLRLNCAEPSDIGNIYTLLTSCYEKKHFGMPERI
jgi:hypothetical protein